MKIKRPLLIKIGNNQSFNEFIQNEVFKRGGTWSSGINTVTEMGVVCYGANYHISVDTEMRMTYGSNMTGITPDGATEFFDVLNGAYQEDVSVSLNERCTAKITKDNVTVGETTLSHELVFEVADAIRKASQSTKFCKGGFIHIGDNPLLDELIQNAIFKAGGIWTAGQKAPINHGTVQYGGRYHLYFDRDLFMSYGGDKPTGGRSHYDKYSVVDLLDALKTINLKTEIKLNDQYTAVINKDAVVVGCQTFTHQAILNLVDEIKKIK